MDARFEILLETARSTYVGHSDLMAFMPFPEDITAQPVTPHHCLCADHFLNETGLTSKSFGPLQAALLAASPIAQWRETYKDTDIGTDFMERFGCYCIIGEGGPFTSDRIRLYMVHMPAQLDYPWHHHPAEEIYFVVSGSAVFRRKGAEDEVLSEGQTSFHASNQPHAMLTKDAPVLCLVAWRNRFETPPVLTL